MRFGIGRCGWGVGVGGSGDVAMESLGEAARRACAPQERPSHRFFLYAQGAVQCELLKDGACPVPLPQRTEGIEQRNGMLFPRLFVSLVSC